MKTFISFISIFTIIVKTISLNFVLFIYFISFINSLFLNFYFIYYNHLVKDSIIYHLLRYFHFQILLPIGKIIAHIFLISELVSRFLL